MPYFDKEVPSLSPPGEGKEGGEGEESQKVETTIPFADVALVDSETPTSNIATFSEESQQEAQDVKDPKSGCCASSYLRLCSLCCVLLAVMVFALLKWYMWGAPTPKKVGNALSDLTNVLKNPAEIGSIFNRNNNPSVKDNTTHVWKTEGEGLDLVILNALDERWYKEFYTAVHDWALSDALELSVEIEPIDNNCEAEHGVMKVCNGNYGDTGWYGYNEFELLYKRKDRPGYMISSAVMMNEYYLHNANYDQRLFTMCHEIGHGFGLPHTDEKFDNENLGDCMDYTINPESNTRPGKVNFDKLSKMYLKSSNATDNNQRPKLHRPGQDDEEECTSSSEDGCTPVEERNYTSSEEELSWNSLSDEEWWEEEWEEGWEETHEEDDEDDWRYESEGRQNIKDENVNKKRGEKVKIRKVRRYLYVNKN